MATIERKSKPRQVEPEVEEGEQPKGTGLRLTMMGIAAVAIIVGMIVLAMFLSNADGKGPSNELLFLFGGLVVLWGALWGFDFVRRRKAA
ncbi:MAG: hypothetical protein QOD77_2087 [Thermoplasmata archaeon]|jgi:hypothetical protein|nr:hypothetical protein [Thermoplasmata archaeon]